MNRMTNPVLQTPLDATARVPGSKSITNRALVLAALAEGESRLSNVLFSDDTVYMSEALSAAGFGVESDPDALEIRVSGGLGQIVAGQNLANPLAAILSFEMALRWSLGRSEAADQLYAAVVKALEAGARTRDLGGALSTVQMGDAVLAAL